MKRLLKIGCANCIMSLFPVLSWYILAFCFNDDRWTNTFLAGYNQQFIWLIIHGLIISGTIKWAYKNNRENEGFIEGSILFATFVMFIESIFVVIFIDEYLNFFNLDTFYKPGVYVYVAYLTIEMLFYGLTKYMNYKGEDSKVLKATIKLYSIRLIGVAVLSVFIKNVLIVLTCSVTATTFYCIYVYYKWIGIKPIKLKPFVGIHMEIPNEISDVFMLIIYVFGLSSLISNSIEAYVAYNMLTLCTDAQWDTLYAAIDTYATTNILNNKGNISRHTIKNSIILSILLQLSSLGMILITRIFFDFDLICCIIMFLLECLMFNIYAFRYVYHSWLTLYYHGSCMSIIPIIAYILRTCISLTIPSIYALSIGVLITGIISNISYLLLYKIRRKKIWEDKVYAEAS